MDIADAVDGGVGIDYRSESYGFDSIDELPWILSSSAIGISIVVGDGAVSVGGHIDKRITGSSDGNHFYAASIGECVNERLACHVGACNGASAVHGHSQCRQADDVGIGPFVVMFCTVSEGVGISDQTFAICYSGIDDRLVMTD